MAPGAELVVIKVMDRDGACYLSDALKALDWCLENKDRYGIRSYHSAWAERAHLTEPPYWTKPATGWLRRD